MLIAALLIIAKKWKHPKCPWTAEWIKKRWFIHAMDYHSAMRRNEVLIHATTWIKLENIMLNERSQSQRTTYYMIPFI